MCYFEINKPQQPTTEEILKTQTLLFSRHGKTLYTGKFPDLTDEGKIQIGRTAEGIAQIIGDRTDIQIVSSPLPRALGSADIIAERLGYPGEIEQEPAIRCMDFYDEEAANAIFKAFGSARNVDHVYPTDPQFEAGVVVEKRVSLGDCYEIGKQFAERAGHLPKLDPQRTAYEDFLLRYKDLQPWVRGVKEITQDKAERYLSYIKDFVEEHRGELDSKSLMGTCVDVHADNIVYTDGALLPFDTYAVKESWLYGYKFLNIYRIATDIYMFLGVPYFEEALRGYEEATREALPRKWDTFLIIYCALVIWPYHYMLSGKEPWRLDVAKKYGDFIEKVFSAK